MFRELLTVDPRNETYLGSDLISLPNLSELVRSREHGEYQNFSTALFAFVDKLQHRIKIDLSSLEDFQTEKLNFACKIEPKHIDSESSVNIDEIYAEITEQPIIILDQCQHFLVTLHWPALSESRIQKGETNDVNRTKISQKIKSKPYFEADPHSESKSCTSQSVAIENVLLSFVCAISSTVFVEECISKQIVSILQERIEPSLQRFSELIVLKKVRLSKNKDGGNRQSTVAQTKYMQIDDRMSLSNFSEIEDEEFHHKVINSNRSNRSSRRSKFHHKNLGAIRNFEPTKILSQADRSFQKRVKKLFSTSDQAESLEVESFQQIAQYLERRRKVHKTEREYFLLGTVATFGQQVQNFTEKISLIKLEEMNFKNIVRSRMQIWSNNYRESLERQFVGIEAKPIEEIKLLLTRNFDQVVGGFLQDVPSLAEGSRQQLYKQFLEKMVSEQNQILLSIGELKQQAISRELEFQHSGNGKVASEPQEKALTNFERIFGRTEIQTLEVGYSSYCEGIKSKFDSIFEALFAGNDTQSSKNAYETGKVPGEKKNISNRIQILRSQKATLQQSLLYEQRLQENLVEYWRNQDQRKGNKKTCLVIPESDEQDL